ncbi:hypothetical protein AGR9A_Cc210075 [Agrobacterium salinitolerans str. Hayward 0363]|nr:hypothetical protein AGR9A_Cc210075 [Agrobacterium salinitolerans str. Hayward 0363]
MPGPTWEALMPRQGWARIVTIAAMISGYFEIGRQVSSPPGLAQTPTSHERAPMWRKYSPLPVSPCDI